MPEYLGMEKVTGLAKVQLGGWFNSKGVKVMRSFDLSTDSSTGN